MLQAGISVSCESNNEPDFRKCRKYLVIVSNNQLLKVSCI